MHQSDLFGLSVVMTAVHLRVIILGCLRSDYSTREGLFINVIASAIVLSLGRKTPIQSDLDSGSLFLL